MYTGYKQAGRQADTQVGTQETDRLHRMSYQQVAGSMHSDAAGEGVVYAVFADVHSGYVSTQVKVKRVPTCTSTHPTPNGTSLA